jgi:hypothetical protein
MPDYRYAVRDAMKAIGSRWGTIRRMVGIAACAFLVLVAIGVATLLFMSREYRTAEHAYDRLSPGFLEVCERLRESHPLTPTDVQRVLSKHAPDVGLAPGSIQPMEDGFRVVLTEHFFAVISKDPQVSVRLERVR